MPIYHFTPPINDKRTMTKDDWSGWYQVTLKINGKPEVRIFWWNSAKWHFGPNKRTNGMTTVALGDVLGIVHLVEQ